MTAGVPGVALGNSSCGPVRPHNRAMLPDRFDRVLAARGREATRWRQKRADAKLVKPDRQDQES